MKGRISSSSIRPACAAKPRSTCLSNATASSGPARVDRSDIAVLVIDATEGVTEQDTKIAGYVHEAGKGCIIVVNKWDLIEKDSKTSHKFEEDIRRELAFLQYALSSSPRP